MNFVDLVVNGLAALILLGILCGIEFAIWFFWKGLHKVAREAFPRLAGKWYRKLLTIPAQGALVCIGIVIALATVLQVMRTLGFPADLKTHPTVEAIEHLLAVACVYFFALAQLSVIMFVIVWIYDWLRGGWTNPAVTHRTNS